MPPRLKHGRAITKCLESTKQCHSTEKTFKCQNRDPECEKIVWNLDGYAEWETGYKMRSYFRDQKHQSTGRYGWEDHLYLPVKFESTLPMMAAAQADVARKLMTIKRRTFLSKKYNAYNRSCRMTAETISDLRRFNIKDSSPSATIQVANPVQPCHRNHAMPDRGNE